MAHETPTITAPLRDRTGTRFAKRLRDSGRLPAVIYGHKTDPVAVSVDAKDVINHLKHGSHVFTVPWRRDKPTIVRAVRDRAGIRHLSEPVYHDNPVDPNGSLVVTDWGEDLPEFVARSCGLETEVLTVRERELGIVSEGVVVFVSRKPRRASTAE